MKPKPPPAGDKQHRRWSRSHSAVLRGTPELPSWPAWHQTREQSKPPGDAPQPSLCSSNKLLQQPSRKNQQQVPVSEERVAQGKEMCVHTSLTSAGADGVGQGLTPPAPHAVRSHPAVPPSCLAAPHGAQHPSTEESQPRPHMPAWRWHTVAALGQDHVGTQRATEKEKA